MIDYRVMSAIETLENVCGKITNLHFGNIRVSGSLSTVLPRKLRLGLAQVLASGVESLFGHIEGGF